MSTLNPFTRGFEVILFSSNLLVVVKGAELISCVPWESSPYLHPSMPVPKSRSFFSLFLFLSWSSAWTKGVQGAINAPWKKRDQNLLVSFVFVSQQLNTKLFVHWCAWNSRSLGMLILVTFVYVWTFLISWMLNQEAPDFWLRVFKVQPDSYVLLSFSSTQTWEVFFPLYFTKLGEI